MIFIARGERVLPEWLHAGLGHEIEAANSGYNRPMTEQEKLADYERVVEIVRDEMKLEQLYVNQRKGWAAIEFIRADAYKRIVDVLMGVHSLPAL